MNDPEIMSFGKKGRYEENNGIDQNRSTRHKMILSIIIALLSVELVNLALWQMGAIPSVPSIFVSEILTCIISFLAGRIYEIFCK